MPAAPRFVTHEQMLRHCGSLITAKTVMVLVNDRIFKREPDGWYLLDDKPRATLEELVDGSAQG